MTQAGEPEVGCRLYLITPPALDPKPFGEQLAAALDGGDVGCLQLRLKGVDDDTIKRAIDSLMPIAIERDVAFILNDRPDLAAAMGCDGVHIGQEDGDFAKARRLLGADRIVGVTCHDSRHLAFDAAEAGADYVAFGACFPSRSKTTEHHATPELFAWWAEVMTVPAVAIGGITAENCGPLVASGVEFLAVISAVWDHPAGPGEGVRAMNRAMSGT